MGTTGDDGDTVSIGFDMDEEAYNGWAETVPRRQSLADRHRELLRADAEHDGDLIADAEGASVTVDDLDAAAADATDTDRMALLKARRHAMRASQRLGGNDDADDVVRNPTYLLHLLGYNPEEAREEITAVLNTLDNAL